MRKTFYMLPRQSGKTSMAIMEFLRAPETTLLITFNQHSVNHIKKLVKEIANVNSKGLSNIISYKSAGQYCRGFIFEKIILDEYMFFDESFNLEWHNIFPTLESNGELIVYSTPNKTYSKEVFDFLRTDRFNMTVSEQVERCHKFSEKQKEDLEQLENSLLVDPSIKLITSSPFLKSLNYHKMCDETSKFLNKTEYNLEIQNTFL